MSAPNWRRNAQLYTELDTTDTTIGIYQGRDDDLSIISFGTYSSDSGDVQSLISVRSSTRYRPRVGEPVILTWTNGRLKMTGPAHPKSSKGVVKSVANPKATVTVDGRDYSLYFAVSIADQLKKGVPVAIDWEYESGYIKDIVSGSDDTSDEPKLTSDQKPFTLNFFAKQSGSRKSFNPPGSAPSYSKWWTQDVIADDDNVSGWFYGNTLRRSLRDDAYIASVEIYLPVRSTKGGLPRIGRHTQDKRPGDKDSLSVSDAGTRKARSGWVRLPVEWAESWRANPGGVALSHGGTTVYKGIQADRQSGKLRIRGRQ